MLDVISPHGDFLYKKYHPSPFKCLCVVMLYILYYFINYCILFPFLFYTLYNVIVKLEFRHHNYKIYAVIPREIIHVIFSIRHQNRERSIYDS